MILKAVLYEPERTSDLSDTMRPYGITMRRYCMIDSETGDILDTNGGMGYVSAQSAHKAWMESGGRAQAIPCSPSARPRGRKDVMHLIEMAWQACRASGLEFGPDELSAALESVNVPDGYTIDKLFRAWKRM